MKKVRLYDLAQVIRSKNSGPFQTTLDVIFDDPELYMQIKASGQITPERVSQAYRMSPDRICEFVFFDTALGFKITFDREISSGTVGDRDLRSPAARSAGHDGNPVGVRREGEEKCI